MELTMIRPALPFRADGWHLKPCPGGLLSLALLAGLMVPVAGAGAFEDLTSAEAIERLAAVRSKEALAGRATPVERISQPLVDGLQPQQAEAPGTGSARRIAGAHPALRLASLGRDLPMSFPLEATPVPDPKTAGPEPLDPAKLPPLSRSGIEWRASADCLAAPLRAVLADLTANFGPFRVNSTCRSKRHNARVGGATRSYHLTGNAVDFRISANAKDVLAFLAKMRTVGGLKHYGGGVFHIDTGPRRTWANNSYGRKRTAKRRRSA
jgi:Peptidase M15